MVEASMQQDIISAPAQIMKLNASHSAMEAFMPELRFDVNWTIAKTKDFLERKFGTSPADMRLQLQNTKGQAVAQMVDNEATLASYDPQPGFTVHVIDESGQVMANEFDDVSKVEKYQISEQDYAKRDDTFRAFKARMQAAGHQNFQKQDGESIYEDFMKEEAEAIALESRCQINVGERRGVVKYVGKIPGKGAGFWVGVLLDEPTGDSNGTFSKKQYFEAGDKCATFVRPNELQVGDFPEKDIFDELEDEI